jgi:hypothetical protein
MPLTGVLRVFCAGAGGAPARRTINRPHHDNDIEVYISGAQHHDGSVTRDVVVHEPHYDHPLTIEQARQLVAAITELVAEADELAGHDRIVVS